jgi:hypothetical protein
MEGIGEELSLLTVYGEMNPTGYLQVADWRGIISLFYPLLV